MSSTAARLFLSKTQSKVILADYSFSQHRQLHKLCHSLVTASSNADHHHNHHQKSDLRNRRDAASVVDLNLRHAAHHHHQQQQHQSRRRFHASVSQAVVFKSKYQIEVPKQDFFSYVLGDIKGHEDAVALVCGLTGRKYTYEKLKDYCIRVGVSMLERGYRKGDVIAIYSPNVPEYVFTILGCASVGITVTMVNPLANLTEITYQLENTKARALFVFPMFAQNAYNAKKDVPRIRDIFLYGMPFVVNPALDLYRRMFQALGGTGDQRPVWLFNELIRPSKGPRGFIRSPWFTEDVNFEPEKDVLILPFSSGTTGLPKGVVHSHQTMIAYADLNFQHPGVQDLSRRENNHFNTLALLPLFHIFGFATQMTGLKFRGTVVHNPRFQPKLFLRTIQKYKITFIPVVPPLVNFLARHPEVDNYNVSSVRVLFCGGAPLSKASADAAMTRLPDLEVVQALGMTEGLVSCTIDEGVPHTSVGQLFPSTELKILDVDTQEERGYNEAGEILVSGPSTMVGYYNNPEATAKSFYYEEDGKKWMYTGDVGYVDENHNLYLVDRIKEMIKYKGHQVSPVEVEQCICQMDQVADAAVIGLPDEDAGELPLAFVVLKDGVSCSIADVMNYVKEKMTTFNQLKGGVIFTDQIPRSIAGKIQRRDLKKMALEKEKNDNNSNKEKNAAAHGS